MADSPQDQPSVINVLCAYIRTEAPIRNAPRLAKKEDSPPTNIQAALTAIATRNPAHDNGAVVDLDGTNLVGADLHDANLNTASVRNSDLARADLTSAWLIGTSFSGTNLSNSDWESASAVQADLSNTTLTGAFFYVADIRNSDLENANLSGMGVDNTMCDGIDIDGAKLYGLPYDQKLYLETGSKLRVNLPKWIEKILGPVQRNPERQW